MLKIATVEWVLESIPVYLLLEDEPDAPVLLNALRSLRFSSSAVGNLLTGGASAGEVTGSGSCVMMTIVSWLAAFVRMSTSVAHFVVLHGRVLVDLRVTVCHIAK